MKVLVGSLLWTRAWLWGLAYLSVTSERLLQYCALFRAQHSAFLLHLLICAGQGALQEAGWFPCVVPICPTHSAPVPP